MIQETILKVKKLDDNAVIPKYAKDGDAGMDLYTLEDTVIKHNQTIIVKTGIAIELPKGREAQVRPRSGVSLNGCKGCKGIKYKNVASINPKQILITNVSPYLRVQLGTIDSNYRGEVGIITYNQENYDVLIPKGTRLAQMVIAPVETVEINVVEELEDSNRGENGFGSTGIK